MEDGPTREFGKRRPVTPLPPAAPVKRSGHVALLLMGTFAIGGGAYALMPRENCPPPPANGATAPQTATSCNPGRSPGNGSRWSGRLWSGSNFFGSGFDSNRSSFGSFSDSEAHGVTRGGFGSFARAISVHFSGS